MMRRATQELGVLVGVVASVVASVVGLMAVAPMAGAQTPRITPTAPAGATVSPRAVGPAAPTAVPIGGLRTQPLSGTTRPVQPQQPYRGRVPIGYPYGYVNGYVDGYASGVLDAPVRGGAVVSSSSSASSSSASSSTTTETSAGRLWAPTIDRPRWRIDSSLTPVQAWRDLIVDDVVCDGNGVCLERSQRVRAPWVATCRCYLFVDALGRRTRVE